MPGHLTFCLTTYGDPHQRNIKVRITDPLLGKLTVDRHKMPVRWKKFPFYDVIMQNNIRNITFISELVCITCEHFGEKLNVTPMNSYTKFIPICFISPLADDRDSYSSSGILQHAHTVYPKKYAHGFCFAVLCSGYTLTDFPISIRPTSLALWQSNDCPSASKATLMNMDKYFMLIHYERLHNHNKAKHNKTCAYFLGYTVYVEWARHPGGHYFRAQRRNMMTSSNETFSALLAICAENSPVRGEFSHKGQWRGALMFSLICVGLKGSINNRDAGDFRRYRVHYDVTVMM